MSKSCKFNFDIHPFQIIKSQNLSKISFQKLNEQITVKII